MKTMIMAAALLLGVSSAFAQEILSDDAAEMVGLLTKKDVLKCAEKFGEYKLANVTVKKTTYRCPGCADYTISGNVLAIDIVTSKVATLKISQRGNFGSFGGQLVTTRTCKVDVTDPTNLQ